MERKMERDTVNIYKRYRRSTHTYINDSFKGHAEVVCFNICYVTLL